ncbi:uncharacterized protein LOC130592184 [Beta vulgaris subsp. vulgaris]|uniref:uncharacterized protein LOC130592184 n=1 Tax=Beta vulgaris subsp. vulgaris TaxID=3555 RepID=UPI002548C689|nr:uncharacterized protein LOC130592184 [Beta vulgaris subsp. vulgaris]
MSEKGSSNMSEMGNIEEEKVVKLIVKSGDLADFGVSYVLGVHTPLAKLYSFYATHVGVDPDDIYLMCRGQFLRPDTNSFVYGFDDTELVLAYSKSGKSVVADVDIDRDYYFVTMRDLQTKPTVRIFRMKCTTKLQRLAMLWASMEGIEPSIVSLYHEQARVDLEGTFDSQGVLDGDVIYVVINYLGG